MSDAARRFHETWLGMVQPSEGLVVTIPALIEADCFERQSADDHRAFLEFLEEAPNESATAGDGPSALRIRDVLDFLIEGLGWNDALLEREPPEDLSLYVAEGGQTIVPTAALRYPDYAKTTEVVGQSLPPAAREGQAFRILVWELPDDLPFHEPETVTGSWEYPPEKKFERLLRECRVPVGLLTNRRVVRLLYAPLGEASGYIDFRVQDMAEVGGRPIFDCTRDAALGRAHRRRRARPPARSNPQALARDAGRGDDRALFAGLHRPRGLASRLRSRRPSAGWRFASPSHGARAGHPLRGPAHGPSSSRVSSLRRGQRPPANRASPLFKALLALRPLRAPRAGARAISRRDEPTLQRLAAALGAIPIASS